VQAGHKCGKKAKFFSYVFLTQEKSLPSEIADHVQNSRLEIFTSIFFEDKVVYNQ